MKFLFLLLTLLPLSAAGQTCLNKPADLRSDTILVYLNSFEESTQLITVEFERTNGPDRLKERSEEIRRYSHNQFRKPIAINDPYALAVREKVVNKLNEEIREICEKATNNKFIAINASTVQRYSTERFRYILHYRYVMINGDPLETQMMLYFHDRMTSQDLIATDLSKVLMFRPFFYYTAEKWYPFYDMLMVSAKKQLRADLSTCLMK